MHRFFCEERAAELFTIRDASENKHIEKVLRLQLGERVELVHQGELFLTELIDVAPARFKWIETLPVQEEPVEITLIQGYPKGQKLQEIIRHGTEIGVNHFIIVEMERSVSEGALRKSERFQRIAHEAAKQSKSLIIPRVEVRSLTEIDFTYYDRVLFFYEESEQKLECSNRGRIAIVIGPEGGFSPKEVTFLRALPNCQEARLGKRILRTETASLVAVAIIRDRLGDL